MRSAECGVRIAECGVRNAECGLRSSVAEGRRALRVGRLGDGLEVGSWELSIVRGRPRVDGLALLVR